MPSSELKEQFQSFLVELNNKDELPTTSEYKGPTLLWHDYESWGVNPKYVKSPMIIFPIRWHV
jgi:exodeoxyribonuclease-1